MSIKLVMPSNHLILCHPLFLPPIIFLSIRVFSNESVLCIRWPEDWSFSFSISPSNEYSEMISFRIDWLDLLAVQGTLKSLLQDHSSKASILRCSAFFTVQLSHPYMTTGKTIALTRRTFLKLSPNHIQNSLLMVHFSQTSSLSVPTTVFFHPKKPPRSQAYFLFPSQNAIPFLITSLLKTHSLLPLSYQELTFILAFYGLVSINTSDNF